MGSESDHQVCCAYDLCGARFTPSKWQRHRIRGGHAVYCGLSCAARAGNPPLIARLPRNGRMRSIGPETAVSARRRRIEALAADGLGECARCGCVLPREQFPGRADRPGGHYWRCEDCRMRTHRGRLRKRCAPLTKDAARLMCTICEEEKPREAFCRKSAKSTGRSGVCRECTSRKRYADRWGTLEGYPGYAERPSDRAEIQRRRAARNAGYRRRLTDAYVRAMLSAETGIPNSEVTQGLIKAKRAVLSLKRLSERMSYEEFTPDPSGTSGMPGQSR